MPELFVNAEGMAMTRAASNMSWISTARGCRKLSVLAGAPCPRTNCGIVVLWSCLQATRDIRKVALWLGHADIRTTEIICVSMLREAGGGRGGRSARAAAWAVQGPRRIDRLSVGGDDGLAMMRRVGMAPAIPTPRSEAGLRLASIFAEKASNNGLSPSSSVSAAASLTATQRISRCSISGQTLSCRLTARGKTATSQITARPSSSSNLL